MHPLYQPLETKNRNLEFILPYISILASRDVNSLKNKSDDAVDNILKGNRENLSIKRCFSAFNIII